MNRITVRLCFMAALMLPATASSQSFLSRYEGVPYHDNVYHGGPQKIPGRVCAYYDLGGEGIAFHDSDPQNHGSGELNPADGSYPNEFRVHEGSIFPIRSFTSSPRRLTTIPSARSCLLQTFYMLAGPSLASGSTLLSMWRTRELIWPIFSTPPIVAELSLST